MYTFLLPDGRTRYLPTSWGEVTAGHAANQSYAEPDVYGVLGMWLVLSRAEVMNLPAALLTPKLLEVLHFALGEVPAFPMPEAVYVAGVRLPLPASPEAGTFGQATDLAGVLGDDALPLAEKRIHALAIYLYPLYYRCPYDSDQVPAFRELCRDIVLPEAVPVADFFLRSSPVCAAPTSPTSSPSPSRLRNALRAWNNWLRSGTQWPSWTRWRPATASGGATSSA